MKRRMSSAESDDDDLRATLSRSLSAVQYLAIRRSRSTRKAVTAERKLEKALIVRWFSPGSPMMMNASITQKSTSTPSMMSHTDRRYADGPKA